MAKKLAVITGASSGIGEATAKALSKSGFALLLLSKSGDMHALSQLPDTLCTQVDVTDQAAMTDTVNQAEAKWGAVECFVNNAGLMLLGDIADQNPNEWRQMVDVNILGVLNGMHLVLKGMKARGSGTLVNVSSIAGFKTFPNHAAYSATKYAVHAVSETVREEVAPFGVRVVTISPGVVETGLLGHTTSTAIKEEYTSWKHSMGGALRPEQIAEAIVFAVNQPQSVCVREIVIAPTRQEA